MKRRFGRIDAVTLTLRLTGRWIQSAGKPPVDHMIAELVGSQPFRQVVLQTQSLDEWDSRLPTYLLKFLDECRAKQITVDMSGLPEGVQGLLKLARAVP